MNTCQTLLNHFKCKRRKNHKKFYHWQKSCINFNFNKKSYIEFCHNKKQNYHKPSKRITKADSNFNYNLNRNKLYYKSSVSNFNKLEEKTSKNNKPCSNTNKNFNNIKSSNKNSNN